VLDSAAEHDQEGEVWIQRSSRAQPVVPCRVAPLWPATKSLPLALVSCDPSGLPVRRSPFRQRSLLPGPSACLGPCYRSIAPCRWDGARWKGQTTCWSRSLSPRPAPGPPSHNRPDSTSGQEPHGAPLPVGRGPAADGRAQTSTGALRQQRAPTPAVDLATCTAPLSPRHSAWRQAIQASGGHGRAAERCCERRARDADLDICRGGRVDATHFGPKPSPYPAY